MKLMILTLVMLILITPFVFCQDLGKITEANFSAAKGQAFYDKERYEDAIEPLENAIKIRPEHARAHYYLCLTYIKLDKREKAVNLLESYLSYATKTNEWLGSMDKEYIEKCEELLSRLKQDPDDSNEAEMGKIIESRKMSMIGSKYYYEKKYEQAMEAFKKAIEIRPQDAIANFSLAVLYKDLGRNKDAINLLDSYLKYIEKEKPFLSDSDLNKYLPQIKGLLEELNKGNIIPTSN